MARPDLSPHVVHFTKGGSRDEAFDRFLAIVGDRQIFGSTNCIKRADSCVCFTEAPLWSVEDGLANPEAYRRYSPFGVMFDKSHIFRNGGRPAIYQADHEFDDLPESHRWRHVRYEPDNEEPIDWTWEREWRVKTDGFGFNPETAVLVVPNDDYANRLREHYEAEQDIRVLQYSQIMSDDIAIQYREEFPWRTAILSQ